MSIALPGLERPRSATPIRASIGETKSISKRGADGKPYTVTFPARGGKWRITRPSADDGNRWVLDEALQAALERYAEECFLNEPYAGEPVPALSPRPAPPPPKPTRLPIRLWSNNPADFLHQDRSFWSGSVCRCHSTGFEYKPRELCVEQGIPWPAPDAEAMREEYYLGTAEWRSYRQEKLEGGAVKHIKTGSAPRVCDPARCPFATGDLAHFKGDAQAEPLRGWLEAKKEGQRALCKNRTILVFELDLPTTNRAGALCRFTSTGIFTAMYLRSSLQQIAVNTGGWLAAVPLYLVLEKTPLRNTPAGPQRLPYVRFESRVATGELQAQAEAVSNRLLLNQGRLLQLQAASAESIREEAAREFDPGYAAEFATGKAPEEEVIEDAEFAQIVEEPAPETAPVDPDANLTEAEFRARITQLAEGVWSAAVLKAKLGRCDSPESYAALLSEARAARGELPL